MTHYPKELILILIWKNLYKSLSERTYINPYQKELISILLILILIRRNLYQSLLELTYINHYPTELIVILIWKNLYDSLSERTYINPYQKELISILTWMNLYKSLSDRTYSNPYLKEFILILMHKNIILILIRMIVAISTLRCFRKLLFPINHDLVNCYGFSNYHEYVPLVIGTSRSFPHSWIVTGFVTRVTRRMLVEQKLPTLPEHLSSSRFPVRFMLLDL
jgi:hypothetical protein